MALEARLAERLGLEVQTIWSDDGIAIRLPEGESSLDGVEALLFPDPEEVEDLVVGRVGQSSLFASRFRENAARALLLPRRRPGHADPAVAAAPAGGRPAGRGVEVRELPDPRRDLPRVPRRRVRPRRRCARSSTASAGARSPSTRRDAQGVGVRELAAVRLHRAVHVRGRRAAGRAAGAGAHAGPRPAARAAGPGGAARAARSRGARGPRAEPPGARRRAARQRPGPGPRPPAAARRPDDRRGGRADGRRAARGLAPPRGAGRVAARGPGADRRRGALDRDGGRRALPRRRRRRGPAGRAAGVPRARGRARSTACSPGMRGPTGRSWAASPPAAGACRRAWSRTRSTGWSPRAACSSGEFRPGGAEREYCDPEVLRLLRRRSLAKLRREVEPVDPVTLARFLPAWQGVAPSPSAGSAAPGAAARAERPRAPGRGRRPAGRPADPGLGPRARRAPGPGPRLPAAAARRAGRDGRGRLGGAGEPRSRRRPGGAVPAGSRAAAADRAARRRRAAVGRDPRADPGAPPAARRLVLPRAVHGVGRAVGPRGARRAVGPRLGGRGDQRHVRAAPRAALEAAARRTGGRGRDG